jgi:hypothetical protein
VPNRSTEPVVLHRKSIIATALDASGTSLGEANFGASADALTAFLRTLPGSNHVVMEPCTIWDPLYERLEHDGFQAVLTDPLRRYPGVAWRASHNGALNR